MGRATFIIVLLAVRRQGLRIVVTEFVDSRGQVRVLAINLKRTGVSKVVKEVFERLVDLLDVAARKLRLDT